MKAHKHGFLLLGLFLLLSTVGLSQQYTLRDEEEIAYQAQLTLSMYQDLLNVISYQDLATESEIKDLIRNSYTNSKSQLFYSAEAVIEDNIKPSYTSSQPAQDKTIKDYLGYFDLAYVKSAGASINFSDFEVSDLKYGSYLYIKVKYTSLFKGQHKEDSATYKAVDRVAEFRAEQRDNRWKTFITSILFYDPAKPVSSREGNVTLAQAFSDRGSFVEFSNQVNQAANASTVAKPQPVLFSEKKKAQDSLFNYHLKVGSIALKEKRLEAAFTAFTEAEKINPFHQNLWKKLLELTKAQHLQMKNAEASYDLIKLNGDKALNARDYVKAKNLYAEALQLRPGTESLKNDIEKLESIIRKISLLESKYAVGEYAEALNDYNEAIENDSINPDYYHGRGKCLIKLNALNEALSDFNQAIQLDGNFIEALSSRARLYTELKLYHQAVADYTLILSNPGYNAAFYPERARVKKMMGDLNGAIEDYNAALLEQPEITDHYCEIGIILFNQQKMGEAISAFNKALEKDPQHVKSIYQRGFAYAALEDLKAASADFKKAIALGLDDYKLAGIQTLSFAYYAQGERAMEAENYRLALENFHNALLIYPAFSRAWLRQGDAAYMLKDYDTAILYYDKAVEDNHVSLGYFKRALAYQQKNDHQSALGDFKSFVQQGKKVIKKAEEAERSTNPSTPETDFTEKPAEACYALGYALLMTHQYAEALTYLDKAIHFSEVYPDAYYARGSAFYALANYKKAIKDFEKSIKQGLIEPVVFYALGKAYLATDQLDEAALRFSFTIELAPEHADAYEDRAFCYRSFGEYDLALKDINAALSLNEALRKNARFMAQKGLMELSLNKVRAANESFNLALGLDEADGWALYGKACALAQEHKLEESLEYYRKAFQSRQIDWSAIKKDPLIGPVSKETAFRELVKTYLKS